MLESLEIEDVGVIERAVFSPSAAFTAVTGETGAGKTMVVTALHLLTGGRADTGRVREGASQLTVTGRFSVHAPAVLERVEEAGGSVDDGELIIVRTVSAKGRSRAWLGGRQVPLAVLSDIGPRLVSIHGQSDQLRLRSPAEQRSVLDEYAGAEAAEALAEFRRHYDAWRASRRQLDVLIAEADARAREADQLRADVATVEHVAPKAGELEEVERNVEGLAHRAELLEAAETAAQALSADATMDANDVSGLLRRAADALDRASVHDDALAALAGRVHELEYQVQDLATELSSYGAAHDEVSLADIDAANGRLAALRGLERRFGSVDDAIELLETGSRRLMELDSDQDTIDRLRESTARNEREARDAAASLTRVRVRAASRLSSAITEELGALAMAGTQGVVRVEPAEIDSSGADRVEFLLAEHEGAVPRPISRSASGGELSRIMLAIEVNLSAGRNKTTMVFDEVDSGVGGAAALEIGRRLARLAQGAQVIAVTHLAQVAAYADQQVSVRKERDGSVVASGLQTLVGEERVREIARMLAGHADSDAALAHARELLGVR